MTTPKEIISQLLDSAGIAINGKNSGDITVHNEELYSRVLRGGSLALGESYMDGWWDCDDLDIFFYKVLSSELSVKTPAWKIFVSYAINFFTNPQSKSRAFIVGEKHYDAGNDLFKVMLDKRLTYTCGYWKGQHTLDDAQEAKLDLVCRKLNLRPGMTVLDIGCGWGSFAKFAAEKYGVKVTGITISKEQVVLAQKNCAGLPVEILLQDYRDVKGAYDVIVSLGMFEHVGKKNYRIYMEVASRCLKDDGLFLLHTIGKTDSDSVDDPWILKYIFPNGMIPSTKQISDAREKLFVIEDWHNFGAYYDNTLMAWHGNFIKGWDMIKNNYDERFYRMWRYYLLSCAGSFRARKIQLWQIVLSKKGVVGGYQSIR